MANIDGRWDCVVKSPLGDQKSTLTVVTDGDSWSGTNAGAMGSGEVSGSFDGETIKWTQQMTVPMPLSLECEATTEGDTLTGTVGAGAFGKFPMTGVRV